jgi:hypothetical protein
MISEADEPKLQPPGAGIPLRHKLFMRWFLPRYERRRDWDTRRRIFRKHGERVLALCRSHPPEVLTRRVLVAPMMGLEDSSRYWSVAMTVEHLVIVGTLQIELIDELSSGRTPQGEAVIAAYKPRGALGLDVLLPRFESLLGDFDSLDPAPPIAGHAETRFRHPWFGLLTAGRWHAVAALHQGLHRRQCEAIAARARPSL